MPQLRKRGNEVAASSADCVSVPAHILSPAVLSLKTSMFLTTNECILVTHYITICHKSAIVSLDMKSYLSNSTIITG